MGEANFSRRKKARYGITGALRLQMKATKRQV
jgi:hypothetical protein